MNQEREGDSPTGVATAETLDKLLRENEAKPGEALSFFCTRCTRRCTNRKARGMRVAYVGGVVRIHCNSCSAPILALQVARRPSLLSRVLRREQ